MTGSRIDYPHPRRLPRPDRQDLDETGREIWDTIESTRGGVWGPYSALLHVPRLAGAVASVGEYLRFGGCLPPAQRELAILCAARLADSPFEWQVHEPVAISSGLPAEIIEHLRSGAPCRLEPRERLIIAMITALNECNRVDDELYGEAEKLFTSKELVELVALAGFYRLLAYVIAAFDVPAPGRT
ncbi:MAG: carboxymuconolactone decarboxylase family protein [Candidatus Melainabacteria bacterium]|nr:carboxymuconolactone decarboxylase family protein [Candidatus Melainabacteria bacterium]